MVTHFRLMDADMKAGIEAKIDYNADTISLEIEEGKPRDFSLSHLMQCMQKPYHIPKPENGWKSSFTADEKARLRPIAETLAMLDGNAFFGNTYTKDGEEKEWYEMYLPEAYVIYSSNGGDDGWAGAAALKD